MTENPRSFQRKVLNIIYILLGFVLLTVGIYKLIVRIDMAEHTSGDFLQDYTALQNLQAGKSIYDPETENTNNHPLSITMLLLPLTRYPYRQAAQLWSIFTLLSLMAQVGIILHTSKIRLPRLYWPVLIGTLLCWYPVQGHIALGQLSIQIALLLTITWFFLRQEKEISAGFALGLACLIKPFPALLIIYLLARQKWRSLISMVITVILGYLVTWFIVGSNDTLYYFTTVLKRNMIEYAASPLNLSFLGVFSRIFIDGPWIRPLIQAPWLSFGLTNILSLMIIALLVYLSRRLPQNQTGNDLA